MRLAKLDLLRIIAVLFVLGRHLVIVYPEGHVAPDLPLLSVWHRFGWTGVDLFFVLSGFLVSGLLFNEYRSHGSINLLRFFVRRGLKIYPAFYFLIAVSVFLKLVPERLSVPRILFEVAFVQNYFEGIWNHTWSLAVEEHFYAAVGVLLFLLSGRRGSDPFRNIHWAFLFSAVLVLMLRIYTASSRPYSHMAHLFPTHLRIDALFFGTLLSYYNSFMQKELALWTNRHRLGILALSVLFILPSFLWDVESSYFMQTFGLSFLYLGFGGFLIVFLYAPGMENSIGHGTLSFFARMGAYSYSIYLWHMPVRIWQEQAVRSIGGFAWSPLIQTAAYVFLSLAVGLGMAKIIEMPILKLRDQFFPSRSKIAAN